MAVIKNTTDFNDILFLKKLIDSIPLSLEDFSFPIDRTTHLILGDVETAYINFEKSYVNYSLLKELDPYNNQLRGNRESLREIRIRLIDQIKQKQLLEQEYVLKQTDLNRHKHLFDKGVISQQEYESKELEFLQMQKNISSMTISISQMREAISTANQQLKTTFINKEEDNTRVVKNLSQSYNALKKSIRDWEHNYVLTSSIKGTVSFQEFWGRKPICK